MIGLGEFFGVFTGMKRFLLLVAGGLALGGVVWNGSGGSTDAPPAGLPEWMGAGLRTGLSEGLPGPGDLVGGRQGPGDEAIRLGLSFIAAMVFGSLLRVAVKTAISLLVIGGCVLWLMQSRGMIEPGWEDYYGSVVESRTWLAAQVGVVGQVLQAHLPSASAALIGFGFGLRR
jgi:uncharacterized membrane protein (Fun14 family)